MSSLEFKHYPEFPGTRTIFSIYNPVNSLNSITKATMLVGLTELISLHHIDSLLYCYFGLSRRFNRFDYPHTLLCTLRPLYDWL